MKGIGERHRVRLPVIPRSPEGSLCGTTYENLSIGILPPNEPGRGHKPQEKPRAGVKQAVEVPPRAPLM